MAKVSHKNMLHARRKKRVRKKISGTPAWPRLSVHRTLKHIYAQVIDDVNGRTLASASSVSLKITGADVDAATQVGQKLGEIAKERSITKVRFDRNGRKFHGRIKALATAARETGLQI